MKKNSLINAFETRNTTTANGALSHSTSGTALLDFFAKGAALRDKTEQDVVNMFALAYKENKDYALRTLFYLSDVRQGQGERRLFRTCLNWLAKNDAKVATKLLKHVPEFTRWDNILESVEDTAVEKKALEFVAKALKADQKAETPSIAAKWAPSENASSDKTRRLAKKLREAMELTPRNYRKMLSTLRAQIGVVERQMCAGEWKKIDFSAVPSRASLIYKNAFNKHAGPQYSKFLTKVEKGEAKINAGVLYPNELINGILAKSQIELRTIEAQWKALPDYCNGESILVLADTSGSMGSLGYSAPINTSVSLALYIAERNTGPFAGYFINFDSDSKLIKVTGNSLVEKFRNIAAAPWGGSTNLQSAFDAILTRAVANNVAEKDMPKKLLIISDMQFNVACGRNDKTNLDVIKQKYANAGYKMPQIVFWNVNAGSDSPAKFDENGVALISGSSPVALKAALTGKIETPWDTFLKVVESDRYKVIKA